MNILKEFKSDVSLGKDSMNRDILASCTGSKGSATIVFDLVLDDEGMYIIKFDRPMTVSASTGAIRFSTGFRQYYDDALIFMINTCDYQEPGND